MKMRRDIAITNLGILAIGLIIIFVVVAVFFPVGSSYEVLGVITEKTITTDCDDDGCSTSYWIRVAEDEKHYDISVYYSNYRHYKIDQLCKLKVQNTILSYLVLSHVCYY